MTVEVDHILLEDTTLTPINAEPGTEVKAKAIVGESLEFVGPFDDDLCDPPGLNSTGIQTKVHVRPSWSENRDTTICLGMSNVGKVTEQLSWTLRAPDEPGDYTVKFGIELPGSGAGPKWESRTLKVSGTGFDGDDDTREDNRDDDGDGDGPFSSGLLQTMIENADVLIVLEIVLFALSTFGPGLADTANSLNSGGQG